MGITHQNHVSQEGLKPLLATSIPQNGVSVRRRVYSAGVVKILAHVLELGSIGGRTSHAERMPR